MHEPENDWLTVSQAAAALGVSERQARRYAGRLAPDDRREAGHEAGHASGQCVRLAAMQAEREKAVPRSKSAVSSERADMRPDIAPDVTTPQTGHATAPASGQYVARLESEVTFLRGLVEQRDRDAAELRAALRKALDAMPKALPTSEGSTPSQAGELAQVGAQKRNGGAMDGLQAPETSEREQEQATRAKRPQTGRNRKISPLQRVALRLLGLPMPNYQK